MPKTLFFCGIGGSGMSALAVILARRGFTILGSDRSRDQGHSPEKFKALESAGIRLFPQDGSGIGYNVDALILSSAVEDSIPDVKAAQDKGVRIRKRAELLAEIFNESPTGISVAGTSGKTTVTGMVTVILDAAGLDPTVMNGGVMLNYTGDSTTGLGNMRVGLGEAFVAETDESDGSIALYNPAIAVLNNVALDHKTMEELDLLFGNFLGQATCAVVLNYDDERVKSLVHAARAPVYSYSLKNSSAGLCAVDIKHRQDGIAFTLQDQDKVHAVRLKVPGAHNVSNALAALSVAKALAVPMKDAISALENFKGIRRRLEVVGTKSGITVIDDFAHNPDKITATLKTLKASPGRLFLMVQPHGFGPLKLMGREMADVFAQHLDKDDILLMPEAFYAGGTADRSVTAQHVVEMVKSAGVQAQWFENRAAIKSIILSGAKQGDRIVVMGARDDTLSDFARKILSEL